jgi:PAS domain S-box-containing protein/diguanylate cyclase (GGDEF)-like protein
MSLGSIFLLPFVPATKLMGKISYSNKVILISIFLILPLSYSAYLLYDDFQTRSNKITHALSNLEKSKGYYQMLIMLKTLQNDGILYLKRANILDLDQMKVTQKNAVDMHLSLLKDEDDAMKSIFQDDFERINHALLNRDEPAFINEIHGYSQHLVRQLSHIDLDNISTQDFSLSNIAYLLSVELPKSTVVTTELGSLRTTKRQKQKLLMKVGELKASVYTTDMILKGFVFYKDRLEKLNLKYQRNVLMQIKYLLSKDPKPSQDKEKELINLQFDLFKTLQAILNIELHKNKTAADEQYQLFVLFVLATSLFGFYLFIGAYLNFKHSLSSFVRTSADIAHGNLGSRVKLDSNDEMGLLSQEFNDMIEELDYNHTLFNEYKKAIGNSVIIIKTDVKGVITHVNKAFENLSGYTRDELVGSSLRKIRSKHTTYEQVQELWKYILNKQVYKTIFENIAKNGKSFYVESTIVPILDRSGKISEFMAIMLDITALYKQKERLHFQLYKDELTSLPNRMKLLKDISISKDAKLILMNIDGFKEINTIFGEAIGNETLQKMAQKIKDTLKTRHKQLYKLAGDEFAILVGEEMSVKDFKADVARLVEYLNDTKLSCGEHEISVKLTMGIVISELNLSSKSLISMADIALKEAKDKMQPCMYYKDIAAENEDLEKNYKMVQLIKDAIEEGKVYCCYQGMLNVKTGRIEKYETLMRLTGTDGKMISPDSFITIAKRARYYPKLTQQVFQEAVYAFMNRTESVSINLSIDDLLDDSTYDFILDILANCGFAERIIFEFLESEEIEFNERVLDFTTKVKKLGARIAIDDFGSGYSNYAYLIKLGVDILKIDSSLIKDIDKNENNRLITKSIIDIAHALGMDTVAEHVHTKEIQDILTAMGADYLQGFYLHKPSSEL